MFMHATVKIVVAAVIAVGGLANGVAVGRELSVQSSVGAIKAEPGRRTASSSGMCATVRAEKVNDGRSPSLRPALKARDAVWYNNADDLIRLIEDCVKVNEPDQYGWTLLHHAADRDRVAIAKILLDHGAVKTIRNKDGKTATQLASSPEMKALLGTPLASPAAARSGGRNLECRQKYEADAALSSDSTGKMRAMRRWQQCLKTGRYW